MQARFKRTSGSLAEKLMAALQGANLAGADSRCLSEGVSSQSAFLRVARPNDSPGKFYVDLQVPSRPTGKEPSTPCKGCTINGRRPRRRWRGIGSLGAGAGG